MSDKKDELTFSDITGRLSDLHFMEFVYDGAPWLVERVGIARRVAFPFVVSGFFLYGAGLIAMYAFLIIFFRVSRFFSTTGKHFNKQGLRASE